LQKGRPCGLSSHGHQSGRCQQAMREDHPRASCLQCENGSSPNCPSYYPSKASTLVAVCRLTCRRRTTDLSIACCLRAASQSSLHAQRAPMVSHRLESIPTSHSSSRSSFIDKKRRMTTRSRRFRSDENRRPSSKLGCVDEIECFLSRYIALTVDNGGKLTEISVVKDFRNR
jgi:hypothetical protein